MKIKKIKVVQICEPQLCNKQPFTSQVGDQTHTFCCEKGFNKSLADFTSFLTGKPKKTKLK